MQLFITNNDTSEQREALFNIFSGEAKREGYFALFKPTFKYILEPQFADIIANIGGKKSRLFCEGQYYRS